MGLLDWLQQGANALFGRFGLGVQIPGFILGLILLIVAYALIRRAEDRRGVGGGSIGARIFGAILAAVGIPILLTSFGVGTTDALLWGLLTLAAGAFWVASGGGKLMLVLGIAAGIIMILVVINVSSTAPQGSVVASGVKTVTDQFGQLVSAILHQK